MPELLTLAAEQVGNAERRVRDGRPAWVVPARAISGDAVMNGVYYPRDEVERSTPGLEGMPVPSGHPVIDGEEVSAWLPRAQILNGIGAYTDNPRWNLGAVEVDIWIDVETARASSQGAEILRRVMRREPMGVSTGLFAEIADEDGRRTARDLRYDHLAILVDEAPAGGRETMTLNTNAMRMRDMAAMDTETLAAAMPENGEMMGVYGDDDGDMMAYMDGDKAMKRAMRDGRPDMETEAEEMTAAEMTGMMRAMREMLSNPGPHANAAEVETNTIHYDPALAADGIRFQLVPDEPAEEEPVTINVDQAIEALGAKGLVAVPQAEAQTLSRLAAAEADRLAALRARVLETNSRLDADDVAGLSEATLNRLLPAQDYALRPGNGIRPTANARPETDFTPYTMRPEAA